MRSTSSVSQIREHARRSAAARSAAAGPEPPLKSMNSRLTRSGGWLAARPRPGSGGIPICRIQWCPRPGSGDRPPGDPDAAGRNFRRRPATGSPGVRPDSAQRREMSGAESGRTSPRAQAAGMAGRGTAGGAGGLQPAAVAVEDRRAGPDRGRSSARPRPVESRAVRPSRTMLASGTECAPGRMLPPGAVPCSGGAIDHLPACGGGRGAQRGAVRLPRAGTAPARRGRSAAPALVALTGTGRQQAATVRPHRAESVTPGRKRAARGTDVRWAMDQHAGAAGRADRRQAAG